MSDRSIALARQVRRSSIEMCARASASHIASALSTADILSVLYADLLRVSPASPNDSGRDRFILSKGHACAALYAVLAHSGFFDVSELQTYGARGTRLMQHASHHVPGVEFSTGSLGHGLPLAVGVALAAQSAGSRWRTYVLLSDGDLNAGSTWESLILAPKFGLGSLTAIIDANGLQSLGPASDVMPLEPLGERLKSFGWDAVEIDGHDHGQLETALGQGPELGSPRVIIARTTKGAGVSFMENSVEWHYRAPSGEDLRLALAEIDAA